MFGICNEYVMYILGYKWNMYWNLNLYICKDVLEEIYGFKLDLILFKIEDLI